MKNRTPTSYIPGVSANEKPTDESVRLELNSLRDAVKSLTVSLQTVTGDRGDKANSAVTFGDLESSGFTIKLGDSPGAVTGIPGPRNPKNTTIYLPGIPVAVGPTSRPTNFTATPIWMAVYLSWDNPTTNFNFVELWRSSTNDISTAVKYEVIATDRFVDYTGSNVTRYYWVRAVGTDGTLTGFLPNSSTGLIGTSGTDPSEIVTNLQDKLSESELTQALQSRIDKVDTSPDNLESRTGVLETSVQALEASSGGLDAAYLYEFAATLDGWTSPNETAAWGSSHLEFSTSGGTVPSGVQSPTGLTADGSLNRVVVARIRPTTAGTDWYGRLRYTTSAHTSFDNNYYKNASPSSAWVQDEWQVITWDMNALDVGGTDWTQGANDITRIELQISNSTVAASWEVDWIQIAQFSSQGLAASVELIDARVDTVEGQFTATASSIFQLEASIEPGGINAVNPLTIVDPAGTYPADGWSEGWNFSNVSGTSSVVYGYSTFAGSGTGSGYSAAVASTGEATLYSDWIPIDDSASYSVALELLKSDAVGTFSVGVQASKDNGATAGSFLAAPVEVELTNGAYYGNIGAYTSLPVVWEYLDANSYLTSWTTLNFSISSTTHVDAPPGLFQDFFEFRDVRSLGTSASVAKDAIRLKAAKVTHIRLNIKTLNNSGTATTLYVKNVRVNPVANTAAVAGRTAIRTEQIARASETGELFAQYTVKVDTNGYVSGFGLASTLRDSVPYSEFTIIADKFSIVNPGSPAKIPFILADVNGVSTLALDGNLVADGSILARHMTADSISANNITVASLDAIAADLGTITAGTIRTASSPNLRLEISSAGNYPIWFGSGAVGGDGTLFSVDTLTPEGGAYFKGTVDVDYVSFPLNFARPNSYPGFTTAQSISNTIAFKLICYSTFSGSVPGSYGPSNAGPNDATSQTAAVFSSGGGISHQPTAYAWSAPFGRVYHWDSKSTDSENIVYGLAGPNDSISIGINGTIGANGGYGIYRQWNDQPWQYRSMPCECQWGVEISYNGSGEWIRPPNSIMQWDQANGPPYTREPLDRIEGYRQDYTLPTNSWPNGGDDPGFMEFRFFLNQTHSFNNSSSWSAGTLEGAASLMYARWQGTVTVTHNKSGLALYTTLASLPSS
tara:strand:- start:1520 stop:4921 length:3402 start_codon:yes stop_codon:yes gene_type:complete